MEDRFLANICADKHKTTGKWVLHYLTDEIRAEQPKAPSVSEAELVEIVASTMHTHVRESSNAYILTWEKSSVEVHKAWRSQAKAAIRALAERGVLSIKGE